MGVQERELVEYVHNCYRVQPCWAYAATIEDALSGTQLGYGATELCERDVCGTELGYGATQYQGRQNVSGTDICTGTMYLVSGTEMWYAPTEFNHVNVATALHKLAKNASR
eukprot:3846793-Rhodomonas_salina.1